MSIKSEIKSIPKWVWVILGLFIVSSIVGGFFGWGKLVTTEKALEESRRSRDVSHVRALHAEQEAETWKKAAKSSKRITVRHLVAVHDGKPILKADGNPAYNYSFEESDYSHIVESKTVTVNVYAERDGYRSITENEYRALVESRTEKSNLRFFGGPSYRFAGEQLDRIGLHGGGRLAWRVGAAGTIHRDCAEVHLLLFF